MAIFYFKVFLVIDFGLDMYFGTIINGAEVNVFSFSPASLSPAPSACSLYP